MNETSSDGDDVKLLLSVPVLLREPSGVSLLLRDRVPCVRVLDADIDVDAVKVGVDDVSTDGDACVDVFDCVRVVDSEADCGLLDKALDVLTDFVALDILFEVVPDSAAEKEFPECDAEIERCVDGVWVHVADTCSDCVFLEPDSVGALRLVDIVDVAADALP